MPAASPPTDTDTVTDTPAAARWTVAVLGPGGVGGLLAALLMDELTGLTEQAEQGSRR